MSRVQPPSTIKVGPWDYAVKFDQATIDRYRVEWDSNQMAGGVSHKACEVFVDPDMPDCQKREVLWHECVHASLRLGQIHDAGKELKGEQFVEIGAPGTLMILRDNPQLVRYLTAD